MSSFHERPTRALTDLSRDAARTAEIIESTLVHSQGSDSRLSWQARLGQLENSTSRHRHIVEASGGDNIQLNKALSSEVVAETTLYTAQRHAILNQRKLDAMDAVRQQRPQRADIDDVLKSAARLRDEKTSWKQRLEPAAAAEAQPWKAVPGARQPLVSSSYLDISALDEQAMQNELIRQRAASLRAPQGEPGPGAGAATAGTSATPGTSATVGARSDGAGPCGRRLYVCAEVLDEQADLNAEIAAASAALQHRNAELMEERRQYWAQERASARDGPMIEAAREVAAIAERAKALAEARREHEVGMERWAVASEL